MRAHDVWSSRDCVMDNKIVGLLIMQQDQAEQDLQLQVRCGGTKESLEDKV